MERAPVTTTPADSPIRILHLSDFHFSTRSQWDADPILRALAGFIAADAAANDLYPDLVILTGDLAQSGKRSEYDLARQWLEDLWPRLTRDPATPLPRDRLLLVPGNHDVDWNRIEPGARDAHQALLAAKTQEAVTERLQSNTTRELLFKRHTAYLKCYGDWLGRRQTLPWWQRRIVIRDQRLHVAGLDSAWLAGGDDDSRLLLGTYQINQTVLHREGEGDCDWRIALLHHPWASLAEFDRNDAQRTLHRHRDLILRGHLHQPDLFRIVPADPRRSCIEAAAGCCYSGKPYPNAFQWIELFPDPRRVRFHFRCWHQDDWQVDRNQAGCPEGMHSIDLPACDHAPAVKPQSQKKSKTTGSDRDDSGQVTGVPQPPARQVAASVAAGPAVRRASSRCDVLLLYVNDKEKQAIIEIFRGPRGGLPKPMSVQGLACLDLRTIGGRRILAMATNMGSATPGGTATLTLDAITALDPEWIIAVGIAFGMDPDKTPIGTILVSDRVSCYEPQRMGRTKTISRGDTVSVHPHLKQHLQTVSAAPYWSGAEVRFGELLSGEKLIDEPAFKGKLRKHYPEAIGGEMEAAGIYSAAMLKQRAWIVVKAVCDFADGNKGDDKDARQKLAAANAATFVRHCLTAYGGERGERHPKSRPIPGSGSVPTPDAPAELRSGGSALSAKEPPATSIRADAVTGIAEALDLVVPLRDALARPLAGVPAASAAVIAERLCASEPVAFGQALSHFRRALDNAKREIRQRQGDLRDLRSRAHDILGWMVVTTVLDGYDQKEAPAVRAWFDGAAFHVPIGRNLCLEVLSARWLKREARFGVARTRRQTGEDDITPVRLGETGFDDPFRITQGHVVNEVWRLIFQYLYKETAPATVDSELRDTLRKRLDIQLNERKRWLRLVIDRADLHNPLNLPAALQAVSQAIPRLHLIVIDAADRAAAGVFLLPAGELAGDIEECLQTIDAIQLPEVTHGTTT